MDLKQIFLANMAQTSDFPLALEFVYAEGTYLFDKDKRPYIDLISGISVSNVGHRHPRVVEAIRDQVDRYLHQMVYGEFIQSPQVKLAQALTKTFGDFRTNKGEWLDNVYFTNSGTEAVEGAMKLAKKYTGRPGIISFPNAYHGSSQGALSLGEDKFRRSFRPLIPGISKIRRNNFDDLRWIDKTTAAVIIELTGAECGIEDTAHDYLNALSEVCKKQGTLLIFDEIQTGFGRTGKFWASEHYGFLPDILLTAKGMGGGMPLGAFIAPREIMSAFKENPILGHITTFGGHPVSCAASLATLQVIQEEISWEDIEQKSALFRSLLRHPRISEVRGKGLMLAAQMENFEVLKNTIDKALELGVITDWFLYCDNAMRIAPPLNITEEQIRKACDIIIKALGD